MNSVMQRYLRTSAALGALGLAFAAAPVHAAGTAAGTNIDNRATVTYSIGGNVQPVVESSPTGNATPGVGGGADTRFVVDRAVNFTLTRVDTGPQDIVPGATAFTTYLLAHLGNANQPFILTPTNSANGTVVSFSTPVTDNADVASFQVFLGPDATSSFPGSATGGWTLLSGPTAAIPANPAGSTDRRIVVLSTAGTVMTNGQIAGIQLVAQAGQPGSPATPETATAGPDGALVQDVVIRNAGGNNTAQAVSAHRVTAPLITVTKGSTVVSDPFNGVSANAKAIPGAVVQYSVSAVNGGPTAATGLRFTDPIPANTTFLTTNSYPTTGPTSGNVEITVGNTTTQCVAEAGSDTNSDGCFVNTTGTPTLNVTVGSGITLPPGAAPANTASFRFRVTVN